MGTPCQAFDVKGEKVWEAELDIYGKIRKLEGAIDFVPFRYQGQYEDIESGLYYNRFRYYDCISGNYISQDPIGLMGNNPNFYGYVSDNNAQIDQFGLDILDSAWKVVQSNINNSGTTVLGHFPRPGENFESYIQKAIRKDASYFDMGDLWNDVQKAGHDPWVLNEKYLDEMIKRNDKVLLNVPKNKIRPGSYLEREIKYLLDNDYKWVNQWSMVKCK